MQQLTIAFVLGLVSALGFAPLSLWPLTIAAFAGLLALIERAHALRRALGIGWWFGLGQFVLGLNWIATAFTFQAAMPAWLGWVAVVLLALYLAVYPALATGIAWRWGAGPGLRALHSGSRETRRRPRLTARRDALSVRLVLLLAAAWIVTEWLRATMFTGFAWNPVGVTWVPTLEIARASQWIGTYGLSALVVLAAGAPWLLSRAQWRPALALLILFALIWAAGLRPAPQPDHGTPIRVVQPNIGQDQKWREDFEQANFARFARLSGKPGSKPRLLLWPEAATPAFLEQDPRARAHIADLLAPRDVVLLGGVALIGDERGRVVGARNSMFVLDATGRLDGRYDKAHLVPYGEYLPMRPILSAIGLSRLAPGDLDFSPGPGARTLDVPGFGPKPLKVGVQICYEIIFSGRVIEAGDRPRFLFNPSNDAWFGRWGPPQHLAQARLRAIEEGIPVVRATPTGISAVVDADGRVRDHLPWKTAGFIAMSVPPPHPPTLFSRYGNVLPLTFAVLLAGCAIAIRHKRR